jgi:hypothetical protein
VVYEYITNTKESSPALRIAAPLRPLLFVLAKLRRSDLSHRYLLGR